MLNPNSPDARQVTRIMQEVAGAKGIQILPLEAGSGDEVEVVFRFLGQRQIGALVVANDPFFTSHRDQLVGLAERHSIPAIYVLREFTEAGGLISYGPSLTAVYREAGDPLAGKILKGAKPADLPVQQPTKFELVINLKIARALGLAVPQSLLARADEIIE